MSISPVSLPFSKYNQARNYSAKSPVRFAANETHSSSNSQNKLSRGNKALLSVGVLDAFYGAGRLMQEGGSSGAIINLVQGIGLTAFALLRHFSSKKERSSHSENSPV